MPKEKRKKDRRPNAKQKPCFGCGRLMCGYWLRGNGTRADSFIGWGHDGNGAFCSVRCGYAFGLKVIRTTEILAKLGQHEEAKQIHREAETRFIASKIKREGGLK